MTYAAWVCQRMLRELALDSTSLDFSVSFSLLEGAFGRLNSNWEAMAWKAMNSECDVFQRCSKHKR